MAATEERAEALRESIEEHKQEIQVAFSELREVARDWTSPSEMIRDRPTPWLLGGLVLGLWLGRR